MADTPFPVARDFRRTAVLVGDGGTVYSGFGFKIFDVNDVAVYLKRSVDTEFALTDTIVVKDAALDYDDFSVTFASAISSSDEYFVIGATAVERTAGVRKGTKIDPDALEREFSRIAMMLNELRRDLNRAVSGDPSMESAMVLAGDIADNQVLIKSGGKIIGGVLLNVADPTDGAAVITALTTKADVSYVDDQLTLKASTGALAAGLALKQDADQAVRLTGAQTLYDKTLNDATLVSPAGVVATADQVLSSTEKAAARDNIEALKLLSWPPASGSGTEIELTGVPASARRITIALAGISTNNTSSLILQLGTSAGYLTSGYLGGAIEAGSGSAGSLSVAVGAFFLSSMPTTSAVISGVATLILVDPDTNTWAFASNMSNSNGQRSYASSGHVVLPNGLTKVRVYASGDTFDAGKVTMHADV